MASHEWCSIHPCENKQNFKHYPKSYVINKNRDTIKIVKHLKLVALEASELVASPQQVN